MRKKNESPIWCNLTFIRHGLHCHTIQINHKLFIKKTHHSLAMLTSAITPGSRLTLVICLTLSLGHFKSMTLLWILIWNLSHVFEPSPQGVFLVVIRKNLVGIRTGPLTGNFLFLISAIISEHTMEYNDYTIIQNNIQKLWKKTLPLSKLLMFLEVNVIRILCLFWSVGVFSTSLNSKSCKKYYRLDVILVLIHYKY